MSLPYQRTLDHLLAELKANLGFASQVLSTGQRNLLTSFLQGGQKFLYQQYIMPELKLIGEAADTSITTVDGTAEYDWPDQVNYRRLLLDGRGGQGVYAKIDGTNWMPLRQGIDWPYDNVSASNQKSFPSRFDVGPKLELWPTPDAAYPIKIEAYKNLMRFLGNQTAWVTANAYSVGDFAIATGAPTWPVDLRDKDHYVFEATAISGTGTSGGTEPTWPTTDGGTVIDNAGPNQITWTARLNTATVDSELVLLHAEARGKAHYRKEDAEFVLSLLNTKLGKLAGQAHGSKRYISTRGGRRGQVDPALFPQNATPFVRS